MRVFFGLPTLRRIKMPVTTVPASSIHAPHSLPSRQQPDTSTPQQSHSRRRDHKPVTSHEEEDHYVLTLLTDITHQATMTALRKKHFPSDLLKVPTAHITLFHALPGSQLPAIKQDVSSVLERARVTQQQQHGMSPEHPSEIHTGPQNVFRMARGVGLDVRGLESAGQVREELRGRWEEWLSAQDRRRAWRGHYTVMNFARESEEVEKCMEELRTGFSGSTGTWKGLRLWLYDRGRWRMIEDFWLGPGGNEPVCDPEVAP
jgi:hypothetical protein